jgi:hypothetical protein
LVFAGLWVLVIGFFPCRIRAETHQRAIAVPAKRGDEWARLQDLDGVTIEGGVLPNYPYEPKKS